MSKLNANEENRYSFNAEEMTVTLNLEDGPVDCAIVVILSLEEQDYIVLLPLDEDGENNEGTVWFYRYFENEANPIEDPTIEYIDSDSEFEAISKVYEDFLENSEIDEIVDLDD